MIDAVFHALAIILEIVGYMMMYQAFLCTPLHRDYKKYLYGLFGVLILYILGETFFGSQFVIYGGKIFGVIIPILYVKERKIKWYVLYPIISLLSVALRFGILFIVAIMLRIPEISISLQNRHYIILELLLIFLLFPFWLYERHMRGVWKEIEMYKRQYVILYVVFFITIVLLNYVRMLGIRGHMSVFEKNIWGLWIIFFCVYLMIISILNGVIGYQSVEYQEKLKDYQEFLALQEKQMKDIILSDEKMRKFRHDFSAHYLVMQSLCDEEKLQELKSYLNTIQSDLKWKHPNSFTGVTSVDAIIAHYLERAKEYGIEVYYKVSLPENIELELVDFCTVLYNLLQNAVEACENCVTKKKIILEVYPLQQAIYLVVQNTVATPFVVSNNELETHKLDKKNHGLGSRSVKDVAAKYYGSVIYRCEENLFISEVILMNKKNDNNSTM